MVVIGSVLRGTAASLSRCLCKLICEWSGQVGAEPVGMGQGEGAEGGFPPLGDGALDEPWRGLALARGQALLLGSLAGALVLDVADRQPQQLDHRVIVGEVASILDDLAELEVQALDRVGRVDDLAEFGWEGQKRDEPLPRVLPGRDRGRVAFPEVGLGKSEQLGLCGLDGGDGVDRAQRRGDLLAVGVGDEPHRRPDQVHVMPISYLGWLGARLLTRMSESFGGSRVSCGLIILGSYGAGHDDDCNHCCGLLPGTASDSVLG